MGDEAEFGAGESFGVATDVTDLRRLDAMLADDRAQGGPGDLHKWQEVTFRYQGRICNGPELAARLTQGKWPEPPPK